jgi:hypothetical protein
MNCTGFEDRIEKLREGMLTPEELASINEHLRSCASCRELLRTASDLLDLPSVPVPPDLTHSILERTSGPVCGRAREHLCDFVDGVLDARYAKLLSLHLENCAGCSLLAAILTDLTECLPQLGEIDPGANFTFRVLRETSRRLPETRGTLLEVVKQWWHRLIRRPRFSWEAAYLGTILLVTVLGNPLTAFHDLSLRAVELYQSRKSFSVVSMALPGSVIRSETGTMKSVREFAGSVSARQQEVINSAAGFFGPEVRSLHASVRSDLQSLRALPPRVASTLRKAWLALFPKSK